MEKLQFFNLKKGKLLIPCKMQSNRGILFLKKPFNAQQNNYTNINYNKKTQKNVFSHFHSSHSDS